MSASYWESTQRLHWTFTRPKLAMMRARAEESERAIVQQYPLPERRHLSIYLMQQIQRLGKKLGNIRQQAMATAQVYVKRYYLMVDIRRTNPYLVAAAALYIACKMEECPQHIRIIVVEAHNLWPDSVMADTSKLGECEFAIISELSSQLIVHHPYRSLAELQPRLGLETEETTLAWSVINDHYLTELPLLHAPHVMAITAALLAVVLRPGQGAGQAQIQAVGLAKALESVTGAAHDATAASSPRVQRVITWLAESAVEIAQLVDCIQELISLYEVWEQYNEKTCKDQIGRLVKGRGLER